MIQMNTVISFCDGLHRVVVVVVVVVTEENAAADDDDDAAAADAVFLIEIEIDQGVVGVGSSSSRHWR